LIIIGGPGSGRCPGGARHIKDTKLKRFRKSINPGMEPASMAKSFAKDMGLKGRNLRLANKSVDRAYKPKKFTPAKLKYTEWSGQGKPARNYKRRTP
jgi:hypothetical protein